jgi:hypothetical protein
MPLTRRDLAKGVAAAAGAALIGPAAFAAETRVGDPPGRADPLQDSLPPLKGGKAPQNLDELWGGYDPAKEPLEIEACKEWEQDGIVLRVVRYRVGVFKGARSTMAAIYGFPKGGGKLPALVEVHGGGQHASARAVIEDARHGYACLSINWGGNPMDTGQVKYDGPNTDWGRLDCTHPPQRTPKNHFVGGASSFAPDEFTLDPVESPRNSNWFIVLVGVRRAITFFAQQPETDPARIGVHGHSMGGKLTTDVSGIDRRIKASAPSCGGAGVVLESQADVPGAQKTTPAPLDLACVADNAYLDRIACPILYLGPTNDFNGHLDNMMYTWRNLPAGQVRFSITPHMNHRHGPEFEVCRYLWFDQHLKGTFAMPATPRIELALKTPDGVPAVTVTPDAARPVKGVDLYYAIDPQITTRFWRDAGARREGEKWSALCPVMSTQQPLFVLANVLYELPESYRALDKIDTFAISSRMLWAGAAELAAAGVKATDRPELMIDDGARGWHDWYVLNWDHPPLWTACTRKLKDPKWRGPDGARLAVDIKSTKENTLVFTFQVNEWGAFSNGPATAWVAEKKLKASDDWQTVEVGLEDLLPAAEKKEKKGKKDEPPRNWQQVAEFSMSPSGAAVKDGQEVKLGGKPWQGPREFRNLRWIPSAKT